MKVKGKLINVRFVDGFNNHAYSYRVLDEFSYKRGDMVVAPTGSIHKPKLKLARIVDVDVPNNFKGEIKPIVCKVHMKQYNNWAATTEDRSRDAEINDLKKQIKALERKYGSA